jgi:IPT/TIG domain/Galactose oxidase, central domain
MTRNASGKVNVVLATLALAASAACSGRKPTVGVTEPSASAPPVTPTVTAISPNSGVAGGAAFMLTVSGTNFDTASTVNFGGTAYATSFVNAAKLTAVIPASAIASAGAVPVTVTNPVTKATSNEVKFTIGAAVVDNFSDGFTRTGDMQRVTGIHTAILLPDGRVLIAGGSNGWTEDWDEAGQNDVELYSPAIGSFTTTVTMAFGRSRAAATLLSNGKVLLTGGEGTGFDQPPVLASAELYDPATSTFASAGSMANARMAHTATLLPNGKVLIAGGGNAGGWGFPVFGDAAAPAELYDPSTNAFSPTGSMGIARFAHTATLLPSGKVLIAGGFSYSLIGMNSAVAAPLASTEIYDPGTGRFTPGPSMAGARGGHTATLLPDGTLLIAGGLTTLGAPNYYPPTPGSSAVLSTAEVRDPTSGEFTFAGKMTAEREEHTATLLPNGKVLLVGGATGAAGTLRSAELYDPATRTFVAAGTMSTPRSGHSATLLRDGSVLITGGHGAGGRWDTGDPGYAGFLHSAEIYHPH